MQGQSTKLQDVVSFFQLSTREIPTTESKASPTYQLSNLSKEHVAKLDNRTDIDESNYKRF